VVLYAFLAHDRPAFESLLSIFGSLLFQLAEVRPDFLEEIYMACTSTHGAQSRLKPMLDVFHKLGKMVDPLFIVVDGLDEIARPKRAELLTELLTTLRVCDKIKVLISSREERDITRLLEDKANSVRVNEENGEEIRKYVRLEGQIWIDDLRGMGADDVDCDVIKKGLEDVVTKAKGKSDIRDHVTISPRSRFKSG
jgi:hypothetical protein